MMQFFQKKSNQQVTAEITKTHELGHIFYVLKLVELRNKIPVQL